MIDLKVAKYGGVEFLFKEVTTNGGNRLIKFRYPNSDKQTIERQGAEVKSYPMVIIIPHENYYTEKSNILRVLDDGKKKTLTHPTDGDIANVINGSYSFSERISELGRAEITVTFEIDDGVGTPQAAGASASQVQKLSNQLNTQLIDDLGAGYKVTPSASGSFANSLDRVSGMLDLFSDIGNIQSSAQVSSFFQTISGFRNTIHSVASSPANLSATVKSLFSAVGGLYTTPSDKFVADKQGFSYGENDPVIVANTFSRAERKQNNDILRGVMRTHSVSNAYASAASIEFATTEELDLAQDEIEAAYIDVRENQNVSNESLELLDKLRVAAQAVFDEKQVTSSAITTVTTERKPLRIFVYDLYGNTDKIDTIADLNKIKRNAFVEGDIKVLV